MNLITRLDFDGIVCTLLLFEMEPIADVSFSDPRTLEEGGLLDLLQPGDIVAHLPFHPDVGTWFHNHDVTHLDQAKLTTIRGKFGRAASTARQIFDFYNSPKLEKYKPLVEIADKVGSANLTEDEVRNPQGWVMLSNTLDPRFSQDRSYGMLVIQSIREGMSVEQVLALPAVARRVELYKKDEQLHEELLKQHSRLDGNVILTDFRQAERVPAGNRFVVFSFYPQGNAQVKLESRAGRRVKVSVSKSIFNRSSNVHVGNLMEEYGGGGMSGAGTCVWGQATADEKLTQLVAKLKG